MQLRAQLIHGAMSGSLGLSTATPSAHQLRNEVSAALAHYPYLSWRENVTSGRNESIPNSAVADVGRTFFVEIEPR